MQRRKTIYLQKGNQAAVVGELRNRNYTDKDGITRYVTEVLASSVEFLTPKPQTQNNNEYEPTPPPEASPYDFQGEQSSIYDNNYQITDDDLPF